MIDVVLLADDDLAALLDAARAEYQRRRDESLRAREAAVREAEESHPIHLEPGLNPAAVTDDLIRTALTRLFLTP